MFIYWITSYYIAIDWDLENKSLLLIDKTQN